MAQIRYEFIFDDNGVITGVERINTGLDGSKKKAESAAESLLSVNNVLRTLGISFGAFEAVQLFKRAVSDALEFQSAMANVDSILGNSEISAQHLASELTQLSGNLGSSRELANAMYEAIGAGIPAAQSVQFVTEATKLAKATLADTGETTKLLAVVMNAYGLKLQDVAHISDVFTETVASGIVRGEELAHELGTVIPTAALLGVSIEEVSAAIATMTRTGISASESTTALNQALLSFIKPSKEAKSIAADLGIELDANTVRSKGFAGALAELKDKVGSNDEALIALFGSVRGGRAALSLTGEQAGFFTEEMKRMETQVGKTNEAFEKQQQTINAQLVRAWNNLDHAISNAVSERGGLVASTLDKWNDAIEGGIGPLDLLTGGIFTLGKNFGITTEANVQAYQSLQKASEALKKHGIVVEQGTMTQQEWEQAIAKANRALLSHTKATEEHTVAQNTSTGLTEEQRKAAEDFSKQVDKLKLSVLGDRDAHRQLTAATQQLLAAGVPLEAITKKLGDRFLEDYNNAKLLKTGTDDLTKKMADLVTQQKTMIEMAELVKIAEKASVNERIADYERLRAKRQEVFDLIKIAEKAVADDAIYQSARSTSAQMADLVNLASKAKETYENDESVRRDTSERVTKLDQEQADKIRKQQSEAAESVRRTWETAAGHITADTSKAFADLILRTGNFKESMIGMLKTTAGGMLEALISGFISPFTNQLAGLGAQLSSGLLGKVGIPGMNGIGGSAANAGVSAGLGAISLGSWGGNLTPAVGQIGGGAGPSGLLGGAHALLTNPWTAVVAGGILGVTAWLKSQAHWEANEVVKKFENPWWQSRGEILPSDKVDFLGALPADEAQRIGMAYKELNDNYKAFIAEYRKGGSDEDLVGGQSLANTQSHYNDEIAALREAVKAGGEIPQFRYGTPYVERTGLALVHQGEAIIPAGRNRSGGSGSFNFAAINVIVQNADKKTIDQIVREGGTKIAKEVVRQIRNGTDGLAVDYRDMHLMRGPA
jgi:TP901 family phage tail tape measure protein